MERPETARTPSLPITPYEGEARVLDTALAAQLGFKRDYDIRELIKRNEDELGSYGALPVQHGQSRGQEFTAFYLNRQQALLVCILSKTEKAKEVRAEVIRRFDAYEAMTRRSGSGRSQRDGPMHQRRA